MKIKRISWQNFKGLADGSIQADGQDVLVSGRNGVGKSTIASMLPYVLFGKRWDCKTAGSLRSFDEDGFTYKDGQIHFAEISFDNGFTLRRTQIDAPNLDGNTSTSRYFNGDKVSAERFNAIVDEFTNGAGELAINPAAFTDKLKSEEQREFLVSHFAETTESSLLDSEKFSELKAAVGDFTVATFIKNSTDAKKNYKRTIGELAASIQTLEKQMEDMPPDLDAAQRSLALEIGSVRKQIADLQAVKLPSAADVNKIYDRINYLERLANSKVNELYKLLNSYREMKTNYLHFKNSETCACPACGQNLPENIRQARIAEIIPKGRQLNADAKPIAFAIADAVAEIKSLRAKVKAMVDAIAQDQAQADKNAALLKKLNQSLEVLLERNTILKVAFKNRKTIDEKREQKRLYEAKIIQLDKLISQAREFQKDFAELTALEINSNFCHVVFKLYDFDINSGEVKPACEPMLHGVPFKSLSKGEQLKASLDILRAIQHAFNVELPIFIDDAESFTANSFIEDIPNQVWFFRVTNSDLTIAIETKEAVA